MRYILFSSTTFGGNCLDALLDLPDAELAGIVTTEARLSFPRVAAPLEIKTFVDFEPLAKTLGVPLFRDVDGFNAERCGEWLKDIRADLFLVLGWYYLLPSSLRSLAPKGAIGIHASLLPNYRGHSPLVWTLINGDSTAGATLFHLGDGADDGDIIAQAEVSVHPEDDIARLYERVTQSSTRMLCDMVPRLGAGTAPRTPQDHTRAITFPRRIPDDGEIDWSWPAQRVHDFIRAQTRPYPGAFTFLGSERIFVWRATYSDGTAIHLSPGALTWNGESFSVACGEGTLLLLDDLTFERGEPLHTGNAGQLGLVPGKAETLGRDVQ